MRESLQARIDQNEKLLDDAAEANLLWNSLISEVRPPKEQFILWIERYGLDLALRAIQATAKKAMKLRSQGTEVDDTIAKYASACMRNMKHSDEQDKDLQSRGFDTSGNHGFKLRFAPGGGLMVGGGSNGRS